MSAYVPIVGMAVLATIFVVVAVAASIHVGPRRRNLSKDDS